MTALLRMRWVVSYRGFGADRDRCDQLVTCPALLRPLEAAHKDGDHTVPSALVLAQPEWEYVPFTSRCIPFLYSASSTSTAQVQLRRCTSSSRPGSPRLVQELGDHEGLICSTSRASEASMALS